MKKLLIPFATLALLSVPAVAHAEECRNSANGRFAKCGTAGSVPASQYVAHGKTKAKPMATATAKPSMMSRMMAKPTPTPTASMAAPMAKPMMARPTPTPTASTKAKAARCKTAKGKFIKCGSPGAVPA